MISSFRNFHPIFFFCSTLNFYVVAQLSVIVCMFVLLSSITRPGCRDCNRSAAQSEVSHRAKPARPEPPTNRRRTQPTRRPTNRDVVKCHPVQAILVSPSLPLRYTPVDHSCSFLCLVLYHEYLSPLRKHCDHAQEETIILFQACRLHLTVGPWPPDMTSRPPCFVFYSSRLASEVQKAILIKN